MIHTISLHFPSSHYFLTQGHAILAPCRSKLCRRELTIRPATLMPFQNTAKMFAQFFQPMINSEGRRWCSPRLKQTLSIQSP